MNNPEIVVSFPSSIADRLRPFISTEFTRYYLNGIHIVPNEQGARFEATNGHIVGVQFAPAIAATEDIIVSLPKPSLVASVIGKLGGLFTVYKCGGVYVLGLKKLAANADEPPAIFENDLLISNCRIDGTYPDIVRVFPTDATQPSPATFSALNLQIVARAVGEIGVRPLGKDETSPAIAYSRDGNFIAALMPVRVERRSAAPLPEWLSPKKQAA